MTGIWLTILAIGLATYAARAAPLFWWYGGVCKRQRSARLELLGPCLLSAMAAMQIIPVLAETVGSRDVFPVVFGLLAVGGIMRIRQDPGTATFSGMIVYFLTS